MARLVFAWLIGIAALLAAGMSVGHAAEADLYCLTGTGPHGQLVFQPASSANPCPTTGGGGGGGGTVAQGNAGSQYWLMTPPVTASSIQSQASVTTAGTAVQLPNNTLVNGFSMCALTTNTGYVTFGSSSVNNTVNGTGNGGVLSAGQCWSFATTNTNAIWINATVSGSGVFYGGN